MSHETERIGRHLEVFADAVTTPSDINFASRRTAIVMNLWALVDQRANGHRIPDDERLALLMERMGEVAAAYAHGHNDIDAEVQSLVAQGLEWLEAKALERAW